MSKKTFGIRISIFVSALLLVYHCSAQAMVTNLKVAFPCDLPPYQFSNDDGNYVGMHIDILNAIAKSKGYVLEYIPMETKAQCMDALDKGEVDLVLGMLMDKDSNYYSQFTNELSSSALCMIMPNDFAELIKNSTEKIPYLISFEYGTATYSFMSSLRASKYIALGSQAEAFQKQISGDTDAMVGVRDSIRYQLSQKGLSNNYTIVRNYMGTIRYTIITQKGDNELLRHLNSGIAALHASSEYETIYNRWMVEEGIENINALMKKILYSSALLASLALVYGISNSRIKSYLKRQVSEKTHEIQVAYEELANRITQTQRESDLRNLIIEHSPSGMILFDKSFTITLSNNSAYSLAGATSPSIGENVLHTNIFGEIVSERVEEVFEDHFSLNNEVISMLTEQGEQKCYRCNINQTIEYGIVIGALLTVEDVTKEEKEKQEIFEKEKNKALNRMIAGIAHEIKNPLMSIRTFAILIKTKGDERQFLDSFAEFVPGEVDRINKLVESLINYAKPVVREMGAVDVKEVIEDCMYLIRTIHKEGKIRLVVDVQENLVIKANKNQIKQCLINILMNSIESMEKKLKNLNQPMEAGLIMNVSAFPLDNLVFITIMDEGVGMNEKELKSCTEPFFTTKAAGTGLGLSLLKVYIQENGGTLSIESLEHTYTKIILKFKRYQNEAKSINNR